MRYFLIPFITVMIICAACTAEVKYESKPIEPEQPNLCKLVVKNEIRYVNIYYCEDKVRNNCFYLTKYLAEGIDIELVPCTLH